MNDPRQLRWVTAALLLACASRCSTIDCPQGSVNHSGQCTKIDSNTGDAGPDATVPEAAGAGAGGSGGAAASGGESAGSGGMSGESAAGAGSGGSAGAAGQSPAGSSGGDPCPTAGMMRCSVLGAGKRDKCMDGNWTAVEACPSGQTCSADGAGEVSCIMIAEACRGSGGQPVCDAQGALLVCNADESVKLQTMCQSSRHCQAGLPSLACATCIPKEDHRCTGATLEVCADDGMSFVKKEACPSAALCNKTAGTCTDAVCTANKVSCDANTLLTCNADGTAWKSMLPCTGGTCDATGGDCNKCEPGSKKCEAGMVMTCNAAGQTYAASACPSATPQCVGLGQCVQCSGNADCSALSNACKVGVCTQNKCVAQNQPNNTGCTTSAGKAGGCSNGTCVCSPQCNGKECGDDGCGGTCGSCSGGQMCVGGQCVDCQNDAQCSGLNGNNGCLEGWCDAGACKTRNAASTKSCGTSGTCRSGTCCTPNCTNKCSGDNGCGGTCPNNCGGGSSCVSGQCCTPDCSDQCGGDNGCGGTCSTNCGSGRTCFNNQCCTPNCTNKCGGSNGCGGTCANNCGSGTTCFNNQCCTPSCGTRCSGSNGCGGTCNLNNCTASGLICQSGECIPPPTIGGLYTSCMGDCATADLTCTQVGPAGPYCYKKVDGSGACPAGMVAFFGTVCLVPCPGSDADKVSPGCPAGAKICYGASSDTGYCVPSTSD